MSRNRRFTVVGLVLAGVIALGAAGLHMAAAGLEPWTPGPAGSLPPIVAVEGQSVGGNLCDAPRGLAVDAAGRAYALCGAGEIAMLAGNATTASMFPARAEGALGLGFGPNGGFVLAGGRRGLLHVGGKPQPTTLLSAADDPALQFVAAVDALHLVPQVLFLDASDRPRRAVWSTALLEHAGRGALYRYDLRSRQATRLLEGLQAPLALAVAPDDSYVLIAETGAYRVLRLWLSGPRAGTRDVFADAVPGYIVALSFGQNGRIWAALAGGRRDGLDGHPLLRAGLARLGIGGAPANDDGAAIAFDLEGHAVLAARPLGAGGGIYGVAEFGPWLWLARDAADTLIRVPLQTLIPSAPPPPPGWQAVPRSPRLLTLKPPEDDD